MGTLIKDYVPLINDFYYCEYTGEYDTFPTGLITSPSRHRHLLRLARFGGDRRVAPPAKQPPAVRLHLELQVP